MGGAMRVLAPMPENASTLTVRGGYQVCARCGEILTEGDSAVTVTRLSNWSIYTHEVGANCPAKAVRGWLAVRTADSMRRLPNQGPATEGQAYRLAGVLRPCMSLLDESHIDAELDLAEYQPSDELQILPSSDAR